MNFNSLTSKLKESAAAAAKGFDFDAMAETDEYIHHDRLNVVVHKNNDDEGGTTTNESRNAISMERRTAWSDDENAQQVDATVHNNNNNNNNNMVSFGSETSAHRGENDQVRAPCNNRQQDFLVRETSSNRITDALGNSEARNNNEGHADSQLPRRNSTAHGDFSRSYSDDDDDEEDDPIFSMIRSKRKGTIGLPGKVSTRVNSSSGDEKRNAHSGTRTNNIRNEKNNNNNHQRQQGQFLEIELSPVAEAAQEKKKAKSHRFFDELDHRTAKPNPMMALEVEEESDDTTRRDASSVKRPWFWNMGIGNNDQRAKPSTAAAPPPLARQSAPRSSTEDSHNDMDFAVVNSADMLGDEERLALAQFKDGVASSTMTSPTTSNVFSMACIKQSMRQHSREYFIILTMLLAAIVYFYARRLSSEDDVT